MNYNKPPGYDPNGFGGQPPMMPPAPMPSNVPMQGGYNQMMQPQNNMMQPDMTTAIVTGMMSMAQSARASRRSSWFMFLIILAVVGIFGTLAIFTLKNFVSAYSKANPNIPTMTIEEEGTFNIWPGSNQNSKTVYFNSKFLSAPDFLIDPRPLGDVPITQGQDFTMEVSISKTMAFIRWKGKDYQGMFGPDGLTFKFKATGDIEKPSDVEEVSNADNSMRVQFLNMPIIKENKAYKMV
ncbi:MAG: hypothetical protein LBU60_02940 [Clostridiales bacterium]|jgi:cytoskeletal protein RodZ|nr:hypothetical protein [Clostridiales bacterium]